MLIVIIDNDYVFFNFFNMDAIRKINIRSNAKTIYERFNNYMILIIDDNKDLANIFCELLNMVGYETIVAYSGKEGIAKAKENKLEAILCDIGMADMNGYDVAKYIRSDDELKDVYMIAVSGYSNPNNLKLSLKAGFNKHLNKPLTIDALKTILDDILNK